jgi:hypothetical protein
MRSNRHPEPAQGPRRSSRSALRMGAAVWLALALASSPALSQERVLVKGLLDMEIWKTDAGSRLLSTNEGDPAPAWRVRLWAAGQIHPSLQGFVLGEREGGQTGDEEEEETGVELEQAFLRYSFRAPLRLALQAGKIPMPIGNFARRYFSDVNPLVGAPDAYGVNYPLGILVSGGISLLDYRLGVIDRPVTNEQYVPESASAPRPVLAIGMTPTTGVRLGAYLTRGPYLSEDLESVLPAGADWKGYDQRIAGVEFQFSRGHFELNADFASSKYDVPTHAQESRGKTYFIEPKYTWSPRFFTALRLEQNDYAFIRPVSSSVWMARTANVYDAEAGFGFRLGPTTLLKVAYRRDHWTVEASRKPMFPDGYSVSAQISHSFDVLSWFERPR